MTRKPIQFPGAFRTPEPPRIVYSTESRSGDCYHDPINYVVDEAAGTVRCRECGRDLNPIWVLKKVYFIVEDNIKRAQRRRK